MHNLIYLIGRTTEEYKENTTTIEIEVSRTYKNENGDYDNDNFVLKLFRPLDYKLEKGTLIGSKGRLVNDNGNIYIQAEKITYLAADREEE